MLDLVGGIVGMVVGYFAAGVFLVYLGSLSLDHTISEITGNSQYSRFEDWAYRNVTNKFNKLWGPVKFGLAVMTSIFIGISLLGGINYLVEGSTQVLWSTDLINGEIVRTYVSVWDFPLAPFHVGSALSPLFTLIGLWYVFVLVAKVLYKVTQKVKKVKAMLVDHINDKDAHK